MWHERRRSCDAPTEPFFSTKPDHDGIGLTIAQGIWRRHRGALSIDSRPGQGTTIRLSIGPILRLLNSRLTEMA